MNEVEALAPERLDEIQSRLNGVEFHDLEVWEESWPAGKGEALILDLGVGITDAHPDSDNAIFPVGVARLFAHAPQDLADALDEIARLRALPTVTEDMVERAIREQWGSRWWDEMLASEDDYDVELVQTYRDEMRDILNAALGTKEGA